VDALNIKQKTGISHKCYQGWKRGGGKSFLGGGGEQKLEGFLSILVLMCLMRLMLYKPLHGYI
jgi:hypothetical protein